MKTVNVVITTYNGRADTLECLGTLARNAFPHRTLVMDDASTDGTEGAVRAAFPDVRVVRNERNLGYARNLNRGLSLSMDSDYVLILNNDLALADDLIARLAEAAESDPRIGLCGPRMYHYAEPRRIWAAGGRISRWTWRSAHITEDSDGPPRDVDYVPGAAMLIRTEVLRKIGAFDPAFVAYFEEVDFAVRVRGGGWRVAHVPHARVWHKVSRTMKRVLGLYRLKFLSSRNRRWTLRRHSASRLRPLLEILDALVTGGQIAWNLVALHPTAAAGVFRGYCAGWRVPGREPAGTGFPVPLS